MSAVLITGGAGFIGSHLADRLIGEGRRVVAFDDVSVGRRANVAHLQHRRDFSFVEGDIADRATLTQIVGDFKIGAIVHLAAVHYIPFCESEPYQAMRINVLGTQAVIDAAVAGGAPARIVFTSTGDVYAAKEGVTSEDDVVEPFTVYGCTKWFSEKLLQQAAAKYPGLAVVVARLFNTYGPRETNPHVLPDVLQQVRTGAGVVRLGNLWPRRDFIFVEDVAEALAALLRADAPFAIYNVGSGVATTIGDAVALVGDVLQRPVTASIDAARTRPVERACLHADITKITRAIGWTPRHTLRDGLQRWLAAEGLLNEIAAEPPRG